MTERFHIGQKVWCISEGAHPRKPARGTYPGVIVEVMAPEEVLHRSMMGPAYEVNVPDVLNSVGTSIWYIEEKNLRPRDDGPELFEEPELGCETPNKKVNWDWRKELKVEQAAVPA